MLQVRSMKNMKSVDSCGINLYPHIKALNTAVRVTLNSIRSFLSNSISLFDFLTLFLYVTVRTAVMILAKMKESCLGHVVQAIPEKEGMLSVHKLCEASMKTIKDAAYTVLLAYDEVLTQGDKVSNVRASGVDDALTTITKYPLFNEDDPLKTGNLDMSKIFDFLETAVEKLNNINAGMTCSSIVSIEKLFSNEDWGLCEVKMYSPDLTKAGPLPCDSELKAELRMCKLYQVIPNYTNNHFIDRELNRPCKKRKLNSKIDHLLNKIVIKIKDDSEKFTTLEEFINKL